MAGLGFDRALKGTDLCLSRSSSVVADLVRLNVGGRPHLLFLGRLEGLRGVPPDPVISAGSFLRVPGARSSGDLTPSDVAGPDGGGAGGAGDAGAFDWTSEPPDPVVPAIKSPSSRAWRV